MLPKKTIYWRTSTFVDRHIDAQVIQNVIFSVPIPIENLSLTISRKQLDQQSSILQDLLRCFKILVIYSV